MELAPRPYVQRRRASDAADRTERILRAALELYVERPLDQLTLAAVAERAGVGLQTLIRRVGTKDGLMTAVGQWVGPQVAADLGDPAGTDGDPAAVAAAFARHYARWSAVLDRGIRQEDASPALKANAESGRRAHRAWISTAFDGRLRALPAERRRLLHARLVAVTGIELWLVLTRDEGHTADEAREALALLISSCLTSEECTP